MLRLRPGFRLSGICCWRSCCRHHPRCTTRSDTSGLFSLFWPFDNQIVYAFLPYCFTNLSGFSWSSLRRPLHCLLPSVIFCCPFSFFTLFLRPSILLSILTCGLDLLLLRRACHDHREQLFSTWQHLSSCSIRQSPEHLLCSCLLFFVDGGRCVFVRVCVSDCLWHFLRLLKDSHPNEKQMSHHFIGWQQMGARSEQSESCRSRSDARGRSCKVGD